MIIYSTFVFGERVRFRPFHVKEERELLIAQQSEDDEVMLNTLDSVIRNCIIGNSPVLTLSSLLYLFGQIRSKSVGELSEAVATCLHCTEKNDVQFDLTTVAIIGEESKIVSLSESLAVTVRLPLAIDENLANDELTKLSKTIQLVHYNNCSYDCENQTDTTDFLLNRSSFELEKIKAAVRDLAITILNVAFKCKKCGKINNIEVKKISEWFVICLAHDTLLNHLKTNFELMQTHHISLSDLDIMLPYEREIHVQLLNQVIKAKNDKARQQ